MPKLLRVVLADDERPARRFLINLLETFPDVEVVGEAANGTDAIALIEAQKPDLALLDLNMPEAGGLDVARLVKAGATPSIAFVTAYDEFAVQAFELNAIDYLLKPVERERLATLGEMRPFIEERLLDVLQPDTGRFGGLTQMKKLAGLAEAHRPLARPRPGERSSNAFPCAAATRR